MGRKAERLDLGLRSVYLRWPSSKGSTGSQVTCQGPVRAPINVSYSLVKIKDLKFDQLVRRKYDVCLLEKILLKFYVFSSAPRVCSGEAHNQAEDFILLSRRQDKRIQSAAKTHLHYELSKGQIKEGWRELGLWQLCRLSPRDTGLLADDWSAFFPVDTQSC